MAVERCFKEKALLQPDNGMVTHAADGGFAKKFAGSFQGEVLVEALGQAGLAGKIIKPEGRMPSPCTDRFYTWLSGFVKEKASNFAGQSYLVERTGIEPVIPP